MSTCTSSLEFEALILIIVKKFIIRSENLHISLRVETYHQSQYVPLNPSVTRSRTLESEVDLLTFSTLTLTSEEAEHPEEMSSVSGGGV